MPGVRGGWIRTGVSWETFAGGYYGFGRVSFADEHRDALTAIADAHRRSVRAFGYGRMPDAILLDHLGPGWVALLRAADRAGVRLLTDLGRAAARWRSRPSPAELVVDVVRTDDGAELHPRLDLPVEPAPAARPTLVGQPATGFFLRDGETLVLGALAEPLDGTRQRLLDLGVVEVPEADWARFTVTHLPGAAAQGARARGLRRPRPAGCRAAAARAAGHLRAGAPGAPGVGVPLRHGRRRGARADGRRRARPDARPGAPSARWSTRCSRSTRSPGSTRSGRSSPGSGGWCPRRGCTGSPRWRSPSCCPVLEELPALELTVVGEPATYSEAVDAPLIQVSTSDPGDGAPTDWFDLGISVTVAGEDVPLAPLIEAIARGHEHLILDSGTWFSLDRPELETLRALVDEARSLQDKPTDPLRISVVHAGLWEELAALGVVEQQSRRAGRRAVGALLDLDAVEPAELPDGLDATLRPYQVDGFRWLSLLWDCGLGGVLADDMGLGKTLQMLAMVLRAHERGELDDPVLVVAPTSVLSTWESEAARFAPGAAHGGRRPHPRQGASAASSRHRSPGPRSSSPRTPWRASTRSRSGRARGVRSCSTRRSS